MQSVKVVNTVI